MQGDIIVRKIKNIEKKIVDIEGRKMGILEQRKKKKKVENLNRKMRIKRDEIDR